MDRKPTYRIKEMFYTLQGEGAQAGRPSVFCRFSKCNLWNGREDGRDSAVCKFCDTDFIGTDGQNGGIYSLSELVDLASSLWPDMKAGTPYVVCTGGEPLLQLDVELISALHSVGFEVAIETNGTLPVPEGVDWVCLSPKADSDIVVNECDEIKLVYPQLIAMPDRFEHIKATHKYLQPMDTSYQDRKNALDNPERQERNRRIISQTVDYCLEHPEWKLSLQTHKWIGID